MKNRNLFFTVLDADDPKITGPAGWISGEGLLPCLCIAISSLRHHMAEGTRDLSEGPIQGGYSLIT